MNSGTVRRPRVVGLSAVILLMFGRCGFAHAELLRMLSKEEQFSPKNLVNEFKGEWRERRRYAEAYPFFSSRVVPEHI